MVIYAIKMMLRSRHCLAKYLKNKAHQASSLLELSPKTLKKLHVKVIILDFDGVLNYYLADIVAKEQHRWLQDCIANYGAENIFILSNKPNNARKKYFTIHFPGVNFIIPRRKKPYPDGILIIQQQTNIHSENLIIIDDRLSTGILASCIAGIKACYITKPLINYYKNPIGEIYFYMLRIIERFIIKII